MISSNIVDNIAKHLACNVCRRCLLSSLIYRYTLAMRLLLTATDSRVCVSDTDMDTHRYYI